MPRCRMRWPSPQSTSRYLPRRRIARTVRPASASTSRGTGQRSRGSRTATPLIMRPASCGARPRRVTSTSGSSGMGKVRLCGAPNIPKMGRIQHGKKTLSPSSPRAFVRLRPRRCAQDPQHERRGAQRADALRVPARRDRRCSAATCALAAKTYLDLAKRTRDPRVARRAVEVANQAQPARARARGGAHLARASSRARRTRCRCSAAMLVARQARRRSRAGAREAAHRRGREPRERRSCS